MGSRTRQHRPAMLLGWGAALLYVLLGAGCSSAPVPLLPTPDADRTLSWLHEDDESAQRLARFGALHETVRLSLIASGGQADWVRHGVVSLPLASCQRAVEV